MTVDLQTVNSIALFELDQRVAKLEKGEVPIGFGARLTKLEHYNSDHLHAYQRLDERISNMHANVVGEIGAFESRIHEVENQPYSDLLRRVKELEGLTKWLESLEEHNRALRTRVTSLERERKELERQSDKWHSALADRIADLERARREQ